MVDYIEKCRSHCSIHMYQWLYECSVHTYGDMLYRPPRKDSLNMNRATFSRLKLLLSNAATLEGENRRKHGFQLALQH